MLTMLTHGDARRAGVRVWDSVKVTVNPFNASWSKLLLFNIEGFNYYYFF